MAFSTFAFLTNKINGQPGPLILLHGLNLTVALLRYPRHGLYGKNFFHDLDTFPPYLTRVDQQLYFKVVPIFAHGPLSFSFGFPRSTTHSSALAAARPSVRRSGAESVESRSLPQSAYTKDSLTISTGRSRCLHAKAVRLLRNKSHKCCAGLSTRS